MIKIVPLPDQYLQLLFHLFKLNANLLATVPYGYFESSHLIKEFIEMVTEPLQGFAHLVECAFCDADSWRSPSKKRPLASSLSVSISRRRKYAKAAARRGGLDKHLHLLTYTLVVAERLPGTFMSPLNRTRQRLSVVAEPLLNGCDDVFNAIAQKLAEPEADQRADKEHEEPPFSPVACCEHAHGGYITGSRKRRTA